MTWWARRRLRAKIFLPFSALVLAALLTTLWLVNSAVTRQVERALQRQLTVTGQVFRGRVAERARRLEAETALLVGDFALKRAIATYDPETLATVAFNYQQRLGVDLLWIADERGGLLADSAGRAPAGRTLDAQAPLAQAMAAQAATAAIAEVGGRLVELVAAPVFAPDPIGYLLAGDFIDDDTAATLEAETGSQVSFIAAGQVFASSWPAAQRARLFAGGRAADLLGHRPGSAFLVQDGGERLLSILVPIDARLAQPLFALVQQSYDRALAPLAALRRRIAGIGVVALAGALLVGAALAGGIAAPLQDLVAAMRRVLTGDFRQRLTLRREDEIGFLARSFNEMVAGLEERETIKDLFGRYVSRDVAAAVLRGLPLQGERREVTILFQDVRGFTSIAERTEPDRLVTIVNHLFTEMVAAVEAQGGIIRQFTGDGVMALFGAPVQHTDDPERAVRAALDMMARLPALNAQLDAAQLPPLRLGIGIHTGEVVVGRIGPDQRIEYGVVGDAPNLASRIEGLTKEMHTPILVSAVTAGRLPPDIRLGRRAVLPVRGKEKPVEVVEVLGDREAAQQRPASATAACNAAGTGRTG